MELLAPPGRCRKPLVNVAVNEGLIVLEVSIAFSILVAVVHAIVTAVTIVNSKSSKLGHPFLRNLVSILSLLFRAEAFVPRGSTALSLALNVARHNQLVVEFTARLGVGVCVAAVPMHRSAKDWLCRVAKSRVTPPGSILRLLVHL